MIAIAHLIAVSCYLGAAALAATPFVRPVSAPVRVVSGVLATGVAAHLVALALAAAALGRLPVTGFGPALSVGAMLLAATLLVAEVAARDASLSLVAAPLAAIATGLALVAGLDPLPDPPGLKGAWLFAHIVLSFLGIAAFATAGAAGAVYLLQRRELRSRRFGAIFRLFPPLETLDRVNHVAAVAGWLNLTIGIVLAVGYAITYRAVDIPEVVWGSSAWACVTALTFGRLLAGWQARRAAMVASVSFASVVALYVAVRAFVDGGQFL